MALKVKSNHKSNIMFTYFVFPIVPKQTMTGGYLFSLHILIGKVECLIAWI